MKRNHSFAGTPAAMLLVLMLVVISGVVRGAGINYVPVFDFDGNLMTTGARFHMEHLNTNTGEWEPYLATLPEHYRIVQTHDTTYRASPTVDELRDFSDQDGDDTFLNQVKQAALNKSHFGAAWPLLLAHVTQGIPFSIITGRNNDPSNVKRGLGMLLSDVLNSDGTMKQALHAFLTDTADKWGFKTSEKYYGGFFASSDENVWQTYMRGWMVNCVGNPWFQARHGCAGTASCKAVVMRQLVEQELMAIRRQGLPWSNQLTVVSFSDDEGSNLDAITELFRLWLLPEYPENVCFRVFDTSDLVHAKQIDIGEACKSIPLSHDWQSLAFKQIIKNN